MAKKKTLTVLGNEITVTSAPNSADFISLTDLAKRFNAERPADLVAAWMRNADTIEFLEVWENSTIPVLTSAIWPRLKKMRAKTGSSFYPENGLK